MDSIRRQFEKEATQTIADFEAYSKKAREEYEKYEAQAVRTILVTLARSNKHGAVTVSWIIHRHNG